MPPAPPGTAPRATAPAPSGTAPQNRTAENQFEAWRLAFVVLADAELATRAVSTAVADSPGVELSRLELLAATLTVSLSRMTDNPDRPSDSAVTAALWQLPAEQRAALWLAKVTELNTADLGAVLNLTPTNSAHVATRAAEWLDVALDHESGPLCSFETQLADFIDDTLPSEEAAEFGDHLPDCPTCQTKVRAFHELSDLKAVLEKAVPSPPAWLSFETLNRPEVGQAGKGPGSLAPPPTRTPAVRPLVACCVALVVLGLIGVVVVHPTKRGSDPPSTSGSNAIVPGLSSPPVFGVDSGPSIDLPVGTATTVVVTTTSVPAVTFPTIPATAKKSRR